MTSTTPTEPEALAALEPILNAIAKSGKIEAVDWHNIRRAICDGEAAMRERAAQIADAELVDTFEDSPEVDAICNSVVSEIAKSIRALSTPAARMLAGEGEAVDDVMIGNFIAQYDEGAAGCMMDADDAQALAREFKRMQGLIYCPGVLRCAKCDFRLIKTKLTPSGAFANEEPDSCPNCNVPMWRVTWKDEANDAYKTAESQMDRALEAERKLAHPPAAEPVKRIEDGHADTEGEANAMFEHQNCPACGGSGHVDDVAAEPVWLREAVEGIADDYMTSEKHHPGYVLIPTAKFEQIVAATERAKEIVPPHYVNWHHDAAQALATPAPNKDVQP